MKTIGIDQLKQRQQEIIKQKEQLIAQVNASIGAINLLTAFIEEEEAAIRAEADSKEQP